MVMINDISEVKKWFKILVQEMAWHQTRNIALPETVDDRIDRRLHVSLYRHEFFDYPSFH